MWAMVAALHISLMGSWHGTWHQVLNSVAILLDALALVLVLLTPSRRFQYGRRSKILTLMVWAISASVGGFYVPVGAVLVWPSIIDRYFERRHPVAS